MGKLAKSPWLLHYDGSSCNGCDIEVLACTTPVYDIERFGIINTGDPFQADILLITGGINSQSESVVKQIYSQMPDPKVVVAVGICVGIGWLLTLGMTGFTLFLSAKLRSQLAIFALCVAVLLLPLFLMLGIVMVMIMVPAMMTMG